MLYRWRRRLRTARFNREIRGILETPPLAVRPAPWTILSMVGNQHVPMYLLALKSVYRRLGAGHVLAIVHGDLGAGWRAALSQHVRGIEIMVRGTLDSGACQRGNLWERLVYVLDRSAGEYVIQMDADILALGPIEEVRAAVAANRPFTMGDGSPLLSMPEAAAQARAANDRDYVGDVAESLLDRYPGAAQLRYVRGSAGFAGFARGGFARSQIETFHTEMETMLGPRWRFWGTEQVGSNFAIANSPSALILPHPDYASFLPGIAGERARLLHFIGSHRFDGGYYARRARAVIADLSAG